MASPPYAISETVPADTDQASNFPALERAFRDIVESWLTLHSDPANGRLNQGIAVLAYVTSDGSNVTGDGTAYTVTGWTEEYDLGADFNASTGVFTAPVNGIYRISGCLTVDGLTSAETRGRVDLDIDDGRDFWLSDASYNGQTVKQVPFSIDVDLDAGDTLSLILEVSNGTKVVDLLGFSTPDRRSWMSITLTSASTT